METIFFSLPGNESLTKALALKTNSNVGLSVIRNFPDGESYIQVQSNVKNKKVFLVCTLGRPNEKIMPLYFLAKTLRSLEASNITLIAPYLPYMRQDKIFNQGEGLSSRFFASLLSSFLDEIITIDPHLHRLHSMSQIYSIPVRVRHAAAYISEWIKVNVADALIVGPDEESEQWVSDIASLAGARYVILKKTRYSDKDVNVTLGDSTEFEMYTPVLIDDIISTGKTMIETIKKLSEIGAKPPVCIAVHAVFAEGAFEELEASGAKTIITCNTVTHISNGIDLSDLLLVQENE